MKTMQNESCDIGLIGLAVMGQNLVLNMNDHGYKVAVFNRTVSKVDDFLANEAKGTQVVGAHSIEELVQSLKRPRRVMMMVKAGDTVDQMIDHVAPFLEKGDFIHWHRRFRWRRGRALRPVHHAGRQPRSVAACERDFSGDRG
jgi:6-phosphogluconate dehydrogenase